jgi:hypothetical protein
VHGIVGDIQRKGCLQSEGFNVLHYAVKHCSATTVDTIIKAAKSKGVPLVNTRAAAVRGA